MKYRSLIFISSIAATLASYTAHSADSIDKGKYVIDPNHSTVTFEVNHLGYTDIIGRFKKLSGDFIVDKADNSLLNVAIESASVDTNHIKRDAHLRSPDFFNAKQFPIITFTSPLETVSTNNEQTIIGKLELLGVSKPVTLNVEKGKEGIDPWGLYRAGYSATAVINRSDYGMNFMQEGLGDEITININIEAVQQ